MDVKLADISMQFPGTRALDRVSVDFRFDEVHGLIGENGAGKSTLVSILGGSLVPSAGKIAFGDEEVHLSSPRGALLRGLAYVSQEGSLVPALSGAENILLGAEPRRAGIIDRRRLRDRAGRLMREWFPEVEIDLGRPVGDLPMADQKVIEIVRALRGDVRLLILDEPTASLPRREKDRLWQIIRSLPPRGVGVVLISHFLSEVLALSHRITVLRDGRHVATLDARQTSEGALIDLMLRRAGADGSVAAGIERHRGETVLKVTGWRAGRVHVPHFEIAAGEIVGLIGLTGSGHLGFARSLHDPRLVQGGRCEISGREVRLGSPHRMQRQGMALVPDQRLQNALIAEWDLRENLAMVHPRHAALGSTGVLSRRREVAESRRVMSLLNVKASSHRQLLKNLSGGNKQKVSIGKWLYGTGDRYRVMVFIEPTEGVDVGAKQEIYAEMRRLAARGVAIVIASSDLIEVEALADRVIPFVDFEARAEIPREEFSEVRFITAMSDTAHGAAA